ncbi:MAG: hypothetical protein K1X56_13905 [Flavobacteriales bacterium]|nr:hypothetical protein [Flavobacteriales bacterium]
MKPTLLLLFSLLAICSYSQSGYGGMLAKGGDWRMCGTYDDFDTLYFHQVEPGTLIEECEGKYLTQLLVYPDNSFRLLNWKNSVCFINEPGSIETNENTGDIRFYFEDGTSRDFLLIFLNKQKLVLVDRNF